MLWTRKRVPFKRFVWLWMVKNAVFVCGWNHYCVRLQEVFAYRRCSLAEVQLYINSRDVHQIWVHRNSLSFPLWCVFCFFLIQFFIQANFQRNVNINIFVFKLKKVLMVVCFVRFLGSDKNIKEKALLFVALFSQLVSPGNNTRHSCGFSVVNY